MMNRISIVFFVVLLKMITACNSNEQLNGITLEEINSEKFINRIFEVKNDLDRIMYFDISFKVYEVLREDNQVFLDIPLRVDTEYFDYDCKIMFGIFDLISDFEIDARNKNFIEKFLYNYEECVFMNSINEKYEFGDGGFVYNFRKLRAEQNRELMIGSYKFFGDTKGFLKDKVDHIEIFKTMLKVRKFRYDFKEHQCIENERRNKRRAEKNRILEKHSKRTM